MDAHIAPQIKINKYMKINKYNIKLTKERTNEKINSFKQTIENAYI